MELHMALIDNLKRRVTTSTSFDAALWPGEPPHAPSREEALAFIQSQTYWYHRIYVGNGLYTMPKAPYHELVWQRFRPAFPADLRGASVLDVGSNAGFFSLQLKLLGAGRVLGIELIDMYLRQADTIKQWWGVDIEYRLGDAHEVDRLNEQFGLVVFAGILYHLKNPLYVLEHVGRVCTDAVLIETECIVDDARNTVVARRGARGQATLTPTKKGFMKFVEADELDGDGSNWWIPDAECVMGMLRVAGFRYFSKPIYLLPNRLMLAASKCPDSLLNLLVLR
jgi:tRNA (mo5U34)-methyltransferase